MSLCPLNLIIRKTTTLYSFVVNELEKLQFIYLYGNDDDDICILFFRKGINFTRLIFEHNIYSPRKQATNNPIYTNAM